MSSRVILYGSMHCHKTTTYKDYLTSRDVDFTFLDVVENLDHAEELRELYKSRKLNFPTLLVGHKKLRNPDLQMLDKWLHNLNLIGRKNEKAPIDKNKFTCGINPFKYYCGDSIEY